MSRFLKYQKKKILAFFFLLLCFILLLLGKVAVSVILGTLFVFVCLLAIVEKKAHKKLNEQVQIFSPNSSVRNVDRLIIGDLLTSDCEEMENAVSICAPGRTLFASFQILRHTHSILRSDGLGEVVIVVKKDSITRKTYSVFDIPFFYYTTIQMQNLYQLQRKGKHLMLHAPIKTTRFVFHLTNTKYYEVGVLDQTIDDFCAERGYRVKYLCNSPNLKKS